MKQSLRSCVSSGDTLLVANGRGMGSPRAPIALVWPAAHVLMDADGSCEGELVLSGETRVAYVIART